MSKELWGKDAEKKRGEREAREAYTIKRNSNNNGRKTNTFEKKAAHQAISSA